MRAVVFAVLVIVTIVAMAVLWPAQAQAPKPRAAASPVVDPIQKLVNDAKADFTKKTGVPATGDLPFDLLQALDVKLLPDLNYGLLLAKATGSTVTAPCYQAWIDVITTQQTAVKDQAGNPVPIPDPHLITDFERMVELRNMLEPDSKFMLACSPVANMVKQDVIAFMGKVISGGAGLATLVPGL